MENHDAQEETNRASRCSPFSPSPFTILIDNTSFVTVTGKEEEEQEKE